MGTHWESSPSPPSQKKNNGRGMNSGLHQIVITINYIMSTTNIMVFSSILWHGKSGENFPKI
jgi:hypothetical protein